MATLHTKLSNGHELKSIKHALGILNEAAHGSSEEVQEMIRADFEHLKTILSEAKPEVKEALRELREASMQSLDKVKEKIVESGKMAIQTVDKSAHNNPWTFVGGTAIGAVLVGYFLGRSATARA